MFYHFSRLKKKSLFVRKYFIMEKNKNLGINISKIYFADIKNVSSTPILTLPKAQVNFIGNNDWIDFYFTK